MTILGEVIFKKNLTEGLPEASRLIDSTMSKRQGHQRKHGFLEKKILHKRENEFTITPRNITPLDGSCYESIDLSISRNIFSCHKLFSMHLELKLTKIE